MILTAVVGIGVGELESSTRLAPPVDQYLQPDSPAGGTAIARWFGSVPAHGSNTVPAGTAIATTHPGSWSLRDL